LDEIDTRAFIVADRAMLYTEPDEENGGHIKFLGCFQKQIGLRQAPVIEHNQKQTFGARFLNLPDESLGVIVSGD